MRGELVHTWGWTTHQASSILRGAHLAVLYTHVTLHSDIDPVGGADHRPLLTHTCGDTDTDTDALMPLPHITRPATGPALRP